MSRTGETSISWARSPPRRPARSTASKSKRAPSYAPARFSRRFPAFSSVSIAAKGKPTNIIYAAFNSITAPILRRHRRRSHQSSHPRARAGLLRHQLADARARQLRRVRQRPVLREHRRLRDRRRLRALRIATPSMLRSSEFGIGNYGYDNVLFAGSPTVGAGNLLYAFQIYHDNGSFERPDEYGKFNGVLRWSQSTLATDFSVTAMGYHGAFHRATKFRSASSPTARSTPTGSSILMTAARPIATRFQRSGSTKTTRALPNQRLRLRAIPQSLLELYLLPGRRHRLLQRHAQPDHVHDRLHDLRPRPAPSRFVRLVLPGKQRARRAARRHAIDRAGFVHLRLRRPARARDKRFVSGLNLQRTFNSSGSATTTAGIGVRNDNISTVGLFLTNDAVQYPNGTLSLAHVIERDSYAWMQTLLRVGTRLQLTPGLRADFYNFNVAAQVAANSGRVNSAIVSPKFTAAYQLSPYQQLYADWGEGFHSNDARGIVDTVDPQTRAPYDALGQAAAAKHAARARRGARGRLPLLARGLNSTFRSVAASFELGTRLRRGRRRHVRRRPDDAPRHRVPQPSISHGLGSHSTPTSPPRTRAFSPIPAVSGRSFPSRSTS